MISIYFGNPGSGKSTLACKMLKQQVKHRPAFANFEHKVKGAMFGDLRGLGQWTFPDGTFAVIDEAGIEYNSRKYKFLSQEAIAYFKKHRHHRHDLVFFSQSWEDIDVTIRRLADQYWYITKIGPFTLSHRIYKRVTVDKNTEQIIDGYRMASPFWLLFWPLQLGWPFAPQFKLTFRPFYYKYFDSWSKDPLPVRDFPVA